MGEGGPVAYAGLVGYAFADWWGCRAPYSFNGVAVTVFPYTFRR